MAQTVATKNTLSVITELAITGPNANTVFSSEIKQVVPNIGQANRRILVAGITSGAITTDFTVDLYGAATSGGTKYLLSSGIISGGLVNTSLKAGVVDLNAFPSPYYYIGLKSTANNSAITADVFVIG